jgi:hypothetical protein
MIRHIPDPPIPVEEQTLSRDRVARRWLKAGVPLVDVHRSPTEGVRLTKLLSYKGAVGNEGRE